MKKNEKLINFQGRKAFMNLRIKRCVIKAFLALYGLEDYSELGNRVSSFEALVPTNQTTH